MSDLPPNPEPSPMLNYSASGGGKISALAIISVVLGGIAIPLDYAFLAGVPLGLIAVILGIIANLRIRRRNQRGKALAIIGIILGGLAMLIGIGCGVFLAIALSNMH